MNLKYIASIILIIGSFFLIFQTINPKPENIKNSGIINYIPNNEKISIISNANSYEINKFLKDNIKKNQKEDFIILKNGIYSLMGFDFQKEFKDVYDSEISLSIFDEGDLKRELLLIIKVKDSITINNILNIENNENYNNKIIEFKRPEKINFLKYAFQTKDNYIIFSSNKDLINLSIKHNQSERLKSKSNHIYPNQSKKNKLVIFVNKNLINNLLGENYLLGDDYFITFLKYNDNKLNIESYSSNNPNKKIYTINKEFTNLNTKKNLILTNNFSYLNKELKFLNINNLQKEILNELKDNVESQIIYSNNSNKWLIAFKSNDPDYILLDNLNKDNNFNKVNLEVDNITYYAFSKDKLNNKDNEINYTKENPIFIKKRNNLIFASNDIKYLLDNKAIENLSQEKFDNNNNILDDQSFINNQTYLNNDSSSIVSNTEPFLNDINTFTSNLFNLKVNKIEVIARQEIPELNTNIFIDSEIQLF